MLAEIFGVDGIIVLIVVVVLLFGGAAIPKLARNLGSAKNEFEKGLDNGKKASGATAVPAPEATVVVAAPSTAPVSETATPAS
jgi:TatA/E family protein of Tat protein translocase